jgi:hypothetical protein
MVTWQQLYRCASAPLQEESRNTYKLNKRHAFTKKMQLIVTAHSKSNLS